MEEEVVEETEDLNVREVMPLDWTESGLLWLINACVFHPRGFSLGYDANENRWVIYGDGQEPWTFVDSPDIHAKMIAVEEFLDSLKE